MNAVSNVLLVVVVVLGVCAIVMTRRWRSVRTELAATKADLDEATRVTATLRDAKNAFLANVSHEVRTPMAAIVGFSDMLLEPHQSPEDRLGHVRAIRRNSEHLLGIVDDMLDLAKLEAGTLGVEPVRTSIDEVLAEVVSVMQARALEARSRLAVEFAGSVPSHVETDPARLRQILINLIGNALKFTRGGNVRLVVGRAACRQDAGLSFAVVDTGIGMTADELARVFAPFTQADMSSTRPYPGTGLGLAVARRLASALGGELVAASVAGVGSTFTLTVRYAPSLPCSELTEPTARSAGTSEVRPVAAVDVAALSGRRVLLAEDGLDNQRLIGALLRKVGMNVTIADDGQKAVDAALLAEAEGEPFDLILMDMQMPVLDGLGAVSLLRAKSYARPIVALTAAAREADRARCLRAGCDDFASKPIQRDQLFATVAAQVRQRLPARRVGT